MDKTVAVVGIGRVGLPLALFFVSRGVKTIGIDIDTEKIDLLNSGKMPFPEKGAEQILKENLGTNFIPTRDFSKLSGSDFIFLTLGTPVDDFMNPDYSQLDSALESMTQYLKQNQTIVLRSTIAPSTTEYVKNKIESKTSLKVGEDFFLVFCPERIAQGHSMNELEILPEIVGGINKKSSERLMSFFNSINKESYSTTARNAELLKLFTNMHRYINFAISNEFMVLAEEWGGNIHEIVTLANKNYPRGGPKKPGFSGGPCLFKDGFFLTSGMPFPDLIAASWSINESIPGYLVNRVKKITSLKGKKCTILGMAFKANNDDQRASLSHKLKKVLRKEMAEVLMHDVYEHGKEFEDFLKESDVVFLAVPHEEYKKEFEYYRKFLKQNAIVVDIWNILKQNNIFIKNSN